MTTAAAKPARFNIKNTVRLWTEERNDCVAIHAEQADGTVKKGYRLKGSRITAEVHLRGIARAQGMTVRPYCGYELEAVR